MKSSAPLTIDDPAYFTRLADVEARHWWALGMWRLASYWLDETLADRAELRALDVGCGTGMTARRLAERPEIREVFGIDPSTDALALADSRHAGPLARGSALALPFEVERFDIVTCFDVFQHLPAGGDRVAASEMQRVLRPGGVAIVRANGRGWSGDVAAYRLHRLVDVLHEAGFQIRRATYANVLPAAVQELRGAVGRRVRAHPTVRGHPGGGGLRIRVPSPVLNRWMTRMSGFEAWLCGRRGVRMPFGHSTLVMAERPRASWE